MRLWVTLVAALVALPVHTPLVPLLGPLPAASAGACRGGYDGGDRPSLGGEWAGLDWYDVDARGVVGATLHASRSRTGRPVKLDRRAAAALPVEVAAGARLVAGVSDDNYASYVAALRPDGSVVFLGNCAYRGATVPFAGHVRRVGGTPRDVFLAIVRDPRGRAARAFGEAPAPRTWWDLPPGQRRVGLGAEPTTPPEVLRRTIEVLLTVEVPRAWRTPQAGLCTRSPIGWGAECALLTASQEGEVTFHAWFARRAPLEVWLVRLDGTTQDEIGVVATIPARYAARERVRLVPDPDVRTWEDLVRVARSTHDALRVR